MYTALILLGIVADYTGPSKAFMYEQLTKLYEYLISNVFWENANIVYELNELYPLSPLEHSSIKWMKISTKFFLSTLRKQN